MKRPGVWILSLSTISFLLSLLVSCQVSETFLTGSISVDLDLSNAVKAGYSVTRVHVTLTHESGAIREEDLTVEGSRAYGTISGLRVGMWNVLAELYEGETVVGSGTTSMEIEAGRTTEVHIRISLATGSANIVVEWGEREVPYLFAFEFSDEYLTGVSTSALSQNGYDYVEEDGKVKWDWSIKYNKDSNHIYNADLVSEATGTIEYDTKTGKFILGLYSMDSLKFLLTFHGAIYPANPSRAAANWIFAVLGRFIASGAIEIEDRSLWDEYSLWWRAIHLPSFQSVTIYNNTGHDIKVVIGFLYGNELWGYPGRNPEADRKWWLPLAKRWSPFDDVDDRGFVKENGEAYIEFSVDISNSSEIFVGANAVNDNGENSRVEIDGETIVSKEDAGCAFKQVTIQNGEHTVKLYGYKTWSHISPRIGMVVIDGDVEVLSAEIYPDEYGDPHPMIIDFPQGASVVEYQEDF